VPTNKPLNEAQAWSYFRDVLLGIEYCKYWHFASFPCMMSSLFCEAAGLDTYFSPVMT